jgi:hypothetical protein
MIDLIPFNEANKALMMKVAEDLSGTCKSLDDVLQTHFGEDVEVTDFDILLLQELDDQVMECQGCNWWHETHELDDNQLCDDCH